MLGEKKMLSKTKQSKNPIAERCRAMLRSQRGYPADDNSGDDTIIYELENEPDK